jgi:hypothetical protein
LCNIKNTDKQTDCFEILSFDTNKDTKDEAEEVDMPAKLTRIDKVREVLEDMDNYLLRKLRSSGLPLAYVV